MINSLIVQIAKGKRLIPSYVTKEFDLFDKINKWARRKSLTLFVMNLNSCCTAHLTEFKMGQGNQMGGIVSHNPARANVLIICGTITHRMGPVIRHVYDQMEKPSWVIALGSCASGGGALHSSYAVSRTLSTIVPVDIFVPGCPVSLDGLVGALDKAVTQRREI